MQESTTREKILKSVRKALIHQSEAPGANFESDKNLFASDVEKDPAIEFAEKLSAAGGTFVYCQDLLEFAEQFIIACNHYQLSNIYSYEPALQEFMKALELPLSTESEHNVLLSTCDSLITRSGSVCISVGSSGNSEKYIKATVHAVIAGANQLTPSIKEAIRKSKEINDQKFPAALHIISGPSKTSDIAMEKVTGVYTTHHLIVFLIDKEPDIKQFLIDINHAK
ncbi:MAG TPA: LUD domain-containing protein [Bacteroidia bacterium]|nr:LUD domain-containing protein [Bacteroidia bacterium]HNT79491.1 LUD domain-containing protein [Bacteroidia bacterium]